MDNNGDIQIPPPQSSQSQQPAAAPAQSASQGINSLLVPMEGAPTGLTGNQIVIGAGISLALAVLFWFIGRILADTLVKQFAEVGAAKRAGISLFAFLTVLSGFATFGFLGNMWLANMFLIPATSLSSLLFVVLIYSVVAANKSKRK